MLEALRDMAVSKRRIFGLESASNKFKFLEAWHDFKRRDEFMNSERHAEIKDEPLQRANIAG